MSDFEVSIATKGVLFFFHYAQTARYVLVPPAKRSVASSPFGFGSTSVWAHLEQQKKYNKVQI